MWCESVIDIDIKYAPEVGRWHTDRTPISDASKFDVRGLYKYFQWNRLNTDRQTQYSNTFYPSPLRSTYRYMKKGDKRRNQGGLEAFEYVWWYFKPKVWYAIWIKIRYALTSSHYMCHYMCSLSRWRPHILRDIPSMDSMISFLMPTIIFIFTTTACVAGLLLAAFEGIEEIHCPIKILLIAKSFINEFYGRVKNGKI